MGVRGQALVVWPLLLAVGLLIAAPFLNRGLVGTGEAFNYSLGVADAIEQLRHGDAPPLAGQTAFAFNSRIHPLRNAPYLFYLAAAVDAVTRHRLPVWQVQNITLVISLVGAVLGCYAGLRWATGCPPWLAGFLASLYGASAPLLCAAHQLDLFMTVHAGCFLPLAVAAAVRSCRQPSFSADVALASALAATWLAHPPVAAWLTFSLVVVRLVHFCLHPSWHGLIGGGAAVVVGLALAAFVFASVSTLNADLTFFAGPTVYRPFVEVIVNGIRQLFPRDVMPVSRTGQAITDLQFGYVPALLLLASLAIAFGRRRKGATVARTLVLVASLLLVLVLPVPGLTHFLWRIVPGPILTLTTEWPMQRLYLVALGITVFGAGLLVPAWMAEKRRSWVLVTGGVLLSLAWTGYQAAPFIRLGYANRWIVADTLQLYRPENLDITVTSYAFLGLPPTFNNGVVDPALEFRILQDGKTEVASNLTAASAVSPIIKRGLVVPVKDRPGVAQSLPIVLQPQHRYLLTLAFKTPPFAGVMTLLGTGMHRFYQMPESGQKNGFGMLDGQRKSIPIWTDGAKPESVVITLGADNAGSVSSVGGRFAEYLLQDIDMSALPVRLESLLPMRLTIDQPLPECTVETPRRFISGYRATVNGLEVKPLMSPTRELMIPIPAGHCVVELSYPGPRSARTAFWISATAWAALLVWRLAGSPLPRQSLRRAGGLIRATGAAAWRFKAAVLVLTACVGVGLYAHQRDVARRAYLAAVGPVRIDFTLPYGQVGLNQPLLTTGHVGAGVIVFITIVDGKHLRLSADVWGRLYQSELLPADFFKVQTLVVSDSALYPPDHPLVRALGADEQKQLRNQIRVELNGKPVIMAQGSAYESKLDEIKVGRADMGSMNGPEFFGEILGYSRLPIPRTVTVPAHDHLTIDLRLPKWTADTRQPLFSFDGGGTPLTGTLEAVGAQQVRFRLRSAAAITAESPPIDLAAGSAHQLEVWPASGADGRADTVALRLDGRALVGASPPKPPTRPSVIVTGLDESHLAGVEARFLGAELNARLQPNRLTEPSAIPESALHLVVVFPAGKAGRHEPLLTTGHAGSGDLIYAVYADDHHLQIGADHWGYPGALSAPLLVDYSRPHELWILSGALLPADFADAKGRGVPAAQQAKLKSSIQVWLDGQRVLSAVISAYPSNPAEITPAQNRIGMSTADPDFSGQVQLAERTAAPDLP